MSPRRMGAHSFYLEFPMTKLDSYRSQIAEIVRLTDEDGALSKVMSDLEADAAEIQQVYDRQMASIADRRARLEDIRDNGEMLLKQLHSKLRRAHVRDGLDAKQEQLRKLRRSFRELATPQRTEE